MNSEQALEKIIDEYEKLRAENAKKRENSIAIVYAKCPQIREIDEKMNMLGQNTLREILKNPDKKGLKEELHNKYIILKQKPAFGGLFVIIQVYLFCRMTYLRRNIRDVHI